MTRTCQGVETTRMDVRRSRERTCQYPGVAELRRRLVYFPAEIQARVLEGVLTPGLRLRVSATELRHLLDTQVVVRNPDNLPAGLTFEALADGAFTATASPYISTSCAAYSRSPIFAVPFFWDTPGDVTFFLQRPENS